MILGFALSDKYFLVPSTDRLLADIDCNLMHYSITNVYYNCGDLHEKCHRCTYATILYFLLMLFFFLTAHDPVQ